MPYNVNAAVLYLDQHASNHSTGFCAKAVRLAIKAGGIDVTPYPPVAKLYGLFLPSHGFHAIPTTSYQPMKGDVVVIQNYPGGNPAGHIAMHDGVRWVSDFKQKDIWAGPGYRTHQPPFAIYRHPGGRP